MPISSDAPQCDSYDVVIVGGAVMGRNFRERLGGDPEIPDIFTHHFGYMYLAGDERFAETFRRNQAVQSELGAGTRIMNPAEITDDYPFYNVDDIICGSRNLTDEGCFDSGTMFDWWRRKARQNGAEQVTDEVVDLAFDSGCVSCAVLAPGETVRYGALVNAAGPHAAVVAR